MDGWREKEWIDRMDGGWMDRCMGRGKDDGMDG